MDWQPIETALKDGSEVLAWRVDCGVLLVRYMCMEDFLTEQELEGHGEETILQNDWWCADFVAGCRLEDGEVPTHWMPLQTLHPNHLPQRRGYGGAGFCANLAE